MDIHAGDERSEAMKEASTEQYYSGIAQTAYTLPEDIEYFYELGCKAIFLNLFRRIYYLRYLLNICNVLDFSLSKYLVSL